MQSVFERLDAQTWDEDRIQMLTQCAQDKQISVSVSDVIRILKSFSKGKYKSCKANPFTSTVLHTLLPISDGWVGAETDKLLKLLSSDGDRLNFLLAMFKAYDGRNCTIHPRTLWDMFTNKDAKLYVSRYILKLINVRTWDMLPGYFKSWQQDAPVMIQWCIDQKRLNVEQSSTIPLSVFLKPFENNLDTMVNVVKVIKPHWKGDIDTKKVLNYFNNKKHKMSKSGNPIEKLLNEMAPNTDIATGKRKASESSIYSYGPQPSKRSRLESFEESNIPASQPTCTICQDKKICTVAIPCGHSYACKGCALQLLPVVSEPNLNTLFNCAICSQQCCDLIPLYVTVTD